MGSPSSNLNLTLNGGQRIKAMHVVSPTAMAVAVQDKDEKKPVIKIWNISEGGRLEQHSMRDPLVVRREGCAAFVMRMVREGGYVCQRAKDDNALTLVKIKGFDI